MVQSPNQQTNFRGSRDQLKKECEVKNKHKT